MKKKFKYYNDETITLEMLYDNETKNTRIYINYEDDTCELVDVILYCKTPNELIDKCRFQAVIDIHESEDEKVENFIKKFWLYNMEIPFSNQI